MKVPTKRSKEEIICGSVKTSNYASLTVEDVLENSVRINISNEASSESAYFTVEGAREAAAFFNNIANVLEGKEQE